MERQLIGWRMRDGMEDQAPLGAVAGGQIRVPPALRKWRHQRQNIMMRQGFRLLLSPVVDRVGQGRGWIVLDTDLCHEISDRFGRVENRLYLFSTQKRRSDISSMLNRMGKPDREFNPQRRRMPKDKAEIDIGQS
ncbi:hypothetical protein [Thiocystis minor]|uniref:hypothetical protein n=1 Tax=Thiocystis minor TaxID=61597 RepID=UPI0019126542|nr:hypothetical protein [Thiocystis minor]